jgi:hypothetical protein
MSAIAVAQPSRRVRPNAHPTPTRHLEIAPSRAQRRGRPRVVYALVTVAGIGVILLAQLLMSIVLADGAYQISGLQAEQRELLRQEHALTESLQVWSSTQNLATNAEGLGMVASGNPVFLDLATGQVSGTGTAAGGSLIGSQGNLIGNSLLDPSMLIDPNQPGTIGAEPVTAPMVPTTSTTPEASTTPGLLPSPTTR